MTNSKTKISRVVVVVFGLMLLAGLSFALYNQNLSDSKKVIDKKSVATQNAKTGTNLDPPNAAQKTDSDQHKDALIASQNPQTPTQPRLTDVTPTVVSAQQSADGQSILIKAYVPGLVEEGGSCAITGTSKTSGAHLTSIPSTPGFANTSYTICEQPFAIANSSFPNKGVWELTVNYKSTTAAGNSTTYSFEVK